MQIIYQAGEPAIGRLVETVPVLCAVVKYALEIETFIQRKDCQAEISRSSAHIRRFVQPVCEQSGMANFFN